MTACICQRGPRTTCPVHGADVSALLVETEQRHRAAGYFDPVDEATALRDETERLRSALATAIAERDAARAEVERACCRGEPHTCDQERAAAAEGRTDRLIIELAEVRARLAEREAQIDATRKPLDIDCTEHAELNGHLDITEQCHDWLSAEADIGDDPSGKMRDFAAALRIVIDQCKKQRRRANWYICAYDAGRAKLVEHWQAKTADAIAAFVETSPQTGDYDFERLASDIRTGGWRKEPK